MTVQIIPKMDDVSRSVENELAGIGEASELIDAMQVETQADLKIAVEMTATIKESWEEINAKRETWTKPLRAVIADINETFAPALDALDEAEKKLKNKIDECVESNEEKRIELLKEVEATPENKRGVLLALADGYAIDKIPGLSIRRSFKGEIVDHSKLVAWIIKTGQYQFLEINEKVLGAITKELQGKVDFPGWEVKEKRTVAITISTVKK